MTTKRHIPRFDQEPGLYVLLGPPGPDENPFFALRREEPDDASANEQLWWSGEFEERQFDSQMAGYEIVRGPLGVRDVTRECID